MAHHVYGTEDEKVLSWNPDDHDRNRVLEYLVEAGYLRVSTSPSDVPGDRSRYTLTEEGLRVASIELSRLEYDIRGEPGGTYENRMRSVADGLRFDPGDAQDPSILAWWSPHTMTRSANASATSNGRGSSASPATFLFVV